MKKIIACNFGDVIFYINTFKNVDFEKQLEHIKKFYIPCKNPKTNVNEININYITNEKMFFKYLQECKRRKGVLYQTFENQVHKEVLIENDNKKVYLIDNEEYICIKDDENNFTILTDGREEGIKWPFRILRELLVRIRENNNELFMHGTGIGIDNNGILLLGNKGSGKTTLAIKLISEENLDKEFISNDRVFLDGNSMKYFPIPIVFASGTVKNNQYLDNYFKKTRLYEKEIGKIYEKTESNDKVPTPLTDIEQIFNNIKLREYKKIDTIIFSKINFNLGKSFKIYDMTDREKFIGLDSTCFTPFDSESLRLEWINKRNKNIEETMENKYDTIQKTIKNKQILRLEYGTEVNGKKVAEDITR